jgi:hypothetical protein
VNVVAGDGPNVNGRVLTGRPNEKEVIMRRITLGTVVAASVLSIGGVAIAKTLQYRAEPVGANEVPANGSSASANLKLKVSSDRTEVRYDLKIDNPIENVLQAHLHRAAVGVNGPIVVWLYPSAPPAMLIEGSFEGRLAEGVITSDDLCFSATAPLCGQWETFLGLVDSGGLYANVHTTAFPPGEIRDQVHSH